MKNDDIKRCGFDQFREQLSLSLSYCVSLSGQTLVGLAGAAVAQMEQLCGDCWWGDSEAIVIVLWHDIPCGLGSSHFQRVRPCTDALLYQALCSVLSSSWRNVDWPFGDWQRCCCLTSVCIYTAGPSGQKAKDNHSTGLCDQNDKSIHSSCQAVTPDHTTVKVYGLLGRSVRLQRNIFRGKKISSSDSHNKLPCPTFLSNKLCGWQVCFSLHSLLSIRGREGISILLCITGCEDDGILCIFFLTNISRIPHRPLFSYQLVWEAWP